MSACGESDGASPDGGCMSVGGLDEASVGASSAGGASVVAGASAVVGGRLGVFARLDLDAARDLLPVFRADREAVKYDQSIRLLLGNQLSENCCYTHQQHQHDSLP